MVYFLVLSAVGFLDRLFVIALQVKSKSTNGVCVTAYMTAMVMDVGR